MALTQFVEQWKRHHGRHNNGNIGLYKVNATGGYLLSYFDEISPAADYQAKKIAHLKRPGIGVPLVALRENRNRSPIESFYRPEAISLPLTAVIAENRLMASGIEVEIHLLCPLQNDQVTYPC